MAKKQFKAESKRLLDLMINSIYTHKEIFLREIISNASDAIDKLCYLSLTDDKVGLDRGDFKIEITVDKDARTLTVSDNGIGMDKDELENNLGVIASSGSYKFRQEAEQKEDIDIIGQFGVGFYSAFMSRTRSRSSRRNTARRPPTAGSPPVRTATPSANVKRRASAPTSSCTSRRTRTRRNIPSTSTAIGSMSW